MSKQDPIYKNVNNKINVPQVDSGLSKVREGGRVDTSWNSINWTKKRIFWVSVVLIVPYVSAILASLISGTYIVTAIFICLGILVAGMVRFARFIDRNDDF